MKPYTTLEEALASRKPGKGDIHFLMGRTDVPMDADAAYQYMIIRNFLPIMAHMRIRKGFMCLKGKEPQDLETLKLILSPEMHLLHLPE